MLGFSPLSLHPRVGPWGRRLGKNKQGRGVGQGDCHGLTINPSTAHGLLGGPEVHLSPHQVTVSREAEEALSPAS